MWKLATLMLVLVGASCGPSVAHAQRETEIYIPIGKSPGVSGKLSDIGRIEAFNAQARTLSLSVGTATNVAKLTPATKIWLDRTKSGKGNRAGTADNCRAGLRCEVKYRYQENRRLEEAEWIKIEVNE